jgi:hypothetical protein
MVSLQCVRFDGLDNVELVIICAMIDPYNGSLHFLC